MNHSNIVEKPYATVQAVYRMHQARWAIADGARCAREPTTIPMLSLAEGTLLTAFTSDCSWGLSLDLPAART